MRCGSRPRSSSRSALATWARVDGHRRRRSREGAAQAAEFDGPIVLHVLTEKGGATRPAERRRREAPARRRRVRPRVGSASVGAGRVHAGVRRGDDQRGREQPEDRRASPRPCPGSTGLLPFQERWPDRFFDVGIAEQHAVTAATGMAMGGLRPVVAIYSTFMNRAWDQVMLRRRRSTSSRSCSASTAPASPATTGRRTHGVMDLALFTKVPGMTVFAPSSARGAAGDAARRARPRGPSVIRYPRGAARQVPDDEVGSGLQARLVRRGAQSEVCLLAVGKLVAAAEAAATELDAERRRLHRVGRAGREAARPGDDRRRGASSPRGHGRRRCPRRRRGQPDRRHARKALHRSRHPPRRGARHTDPFLPHGKPDRILADLGLDGPGIAATIRSILAS